MAWKAMFSVSLMFLLASGCGKSQIQGGPRLKTSPVQGIVHVDGEPAKGVTITVHVEPGKSELNHNVITSTNANGEFFVSTYTQNDGLPFGSYRLTFKWPEITIGDKRPDKLKGAYNNPATSETLLTVEEGHPVDLGIIELSTKKKAAPKK